MQRTTGLGAVALAVLATATWMGCAVNVGDESVEAPLATTQISRFGGVFEAPKGRIELAVDVVHGDGRAEAVWVEREVSPLFWGARAEVRASAERFPRCGVGGEVWLSLLFDDGTYLEVPAENDPHGATASFDVPFGPRAVELWWRSENGDCVDYDSDFARNYRFAIYRWAPTLVRFGADWSEIPGGTLHRGGVLVIDYDLARLATCRGSFRGFPDWYVRANGRFGDTSFAQELTALDYDERGIPTGVVRSDLAIVPIPWDATEVELWFDNGQKIIGNGCRAWDSDFGRNYRFAIEEMQLTVPAQCGEGFALVDRADGSKVAVVRDQAAIEHFLAKSAETFEATLEYSGTTSTVTLERRFPWQISVSGEPGARVLELEELRDVGDGSLLTSGPPGSEVSFDGARVTMSVRASQMPTSRSVVYYDVGRWSFACR
jgi:hypothetical protein